MKTHPSWNRVKQILEAALDRPPVERAGFVVRTCGDDAKHFRSQSSARRFRFRFSASRRGGYHKCVHDSRRWHLRHYGIHESLATEWG